MSAEVANPESVLRTEYEQFQRTYELRHSELRLEIKEIETDNKQQFNALNSKIDVLTVQLARRGVDGWKLAASSSVSLIIGYLLYALQHIILH